MRIALVCAVSSQPTFRQPGAESDPPLGVLGLATVIRGDHDVRIFDGELFHGSSPRYAQQVLDWKPDVVGFSLNFSTRVRTTREMAAYVRSNAPQIPIVLGGNHATFNWQSLIEEPFFDYLVMYEGERSFPDLLRYIAGETSSLPPGVVRRREGEAPEVNRFAGYISDLDTLPHNDFDLFDDPSAYAKAVVTSRGCPYTCIYCSTKEMWRKWRSRSAPNVAKEMLTLSEKYSTSRVLMADDTFLVRKDRCQALCEIFSAEGSPIRWGFSTRLETVPDELIPILSRAGVRWIFFGVESGSEPILKKMKRFYSQADIVRKIRICADHGITVTASFILGLPWETEADIRETFKVMRNLATHRILLNIFTPLSGTTSLEDSESYGIQFIEEHDVERTIVGHGHVNFNLPNLTAEQIKSLWLEGQGIVMEKGRAAPALEAEIERNRYGLMGDTQAPAQQLNDLGPG